MANGKPGRPKSATSSISIELRVPLPFLESIDSFVAEAALRGGPASRSELIRRAVGEFLAQEVAR